MTDLSELLWESMWKIEFTPREQECYELWKRQNSFDQVVHPPSFCCTIDSHGVYETPEQQAANQAYYDWYEQYGEEYYQWLESLPDMQF